MNITKQNNVALLGVCNGTGSLIVDTAKTVADLTEGQMAVVGTNGKVLDANRQDSATTTYTEYKIAIKEDGQLWLSDVIYHNNITYSANHTYTAPTQKVSYIGYNGTSGSIYANNSSDYILNIFKKFETMQHGQADEIKQGVYRSSASATQEEIATGLVKSLINNFKREPVEYMKFERVCDEAGIALGTGVGTLTFTKGSIYFSATDIDDATINAALAVGDYIRLGTAITDPIYRITAINTTTNIGTLDVPVQTSSTGVDTAYEVIPSATAIAAKFGIKFTGIAQTNFEQGIKSYYIPNWEIVLRDTDVWGATTTETVTQKANKGVGTYFEVAELDYQLFGNEGATNIVGSIPSRSFRNRADSSLTYDLVKVGYYGTHSGLLNMARQPRELILACKAGTTASALTTLFAS